MELLPLDSSVLLSRELRAQGFDYDELVRLTSTGRLARIRRGAYTALPPTTPEERHRQLVSATLPQLAPGACASHQSAAVLHRLPSWTDQLARVHVIRSRTGGGRVGKVVHVHPALLDEAGVVVVDGLRVTSLARTVLDLARTTSFARAVAVGDAALRRGLDPSELRQQLADVSGRRGAPAARRALTFLDGRAESVGESLSRVVLHRAGLPAPDLQLEVRDSSGAVLARTDFGWADRRTVGEFDGKVKYGRLLRDGETGGDVVFREKVREDRLRDHGWEVVRWTWADLERPAQIAERCERAFVRGSRRRPPHILDLSAHRPGCAPPG